MHKDCNCNKGSSHFLSGIVVGAIIGFAAGMLLTPTTGKENRKKLKKAKEVTKTKSKEVYSILQEDVLPVLEELKPLLDKFKNEHKVDLFESGEELEEDIQDSKPRFFKRS